MTVLSLADQPAATHKVDALVLTVQAAESGAALTPGHDLPEESDAHLAALLTALDATGRVDDVHVVALVPGITAAKVVLAGISPKNGPAAEADAGSVRLGVGAALSTLGTVESVAVAVPGDHVRSAAEGARLGSYTFTAHKSPATAADPKSTRAPRRGASTAIGADPGAGAAAIRMLVPDAKDKEVKAELARADVVAEATAYARDLVNTPPNLLFPASFVESVQHRVDTGKADIEVVVHDEKKLARLGCGGILGVGQGSSRPPRIMELHYQPKRKARGRIAFVGKGITFDTGGVCIKPAASMLTMKCDMAGAAVAAAAVLAAAELKLPVAVSAYLCLAENMPGGNAQRPGDVVTMRSGTTVEIIDTDAEGRMVLADGMTLAVEAGADAVIDIATLTGACMVALGTKVGGVMANDESLSEKVLAAATEAGEAMWPLPLPEDLRAKLDSNVADLQHKGDQYGGALTAGLFLREFARDAEGKTVPWAHLDIAGPAYLTEPPYGHVIKGGTGFAVATLVELAGTWASA